MCSEGLRPEPKPGFILKKNPCIHQLVVFAEIAWAKKKKSVSETHALGKSIMHRFQNVQDSKRTQLTSPMFWRYKDVK